MKRTVPLLAVALLLLAGMAVPVGGAATGAAGTADHAPQEETPTESNESTEPPAPGAQFAGVVAVQAAEVEGEMDGRSFGIRVARANSNGSKAGVVADQFDDLEGRLDALAERKQALAEARENGSISEARYRAEVAALAARTAAVERQINQTEAATHDLPPGLLESKGVNATAIDRLRNDSRELAGPDVAAIARSVAGPPDGAGLGGADVTRGPPTSEPGQSGESNGTDGASRGPTGGPPAAGDQSDEDARPTPRGPPTDAAGPNVTSRPTPDGVTANSTVENGGGPNSGGGPPAENPGGASGPPSEGPAGNWGGLR